MLPVCVSVHLRLALPEQASVHLQPAARETVYGSELLEAVTATNSRRAWQQLAADCFALRESELPFYKQLYLSMHLCVCGLMHQNLCTAVRIYKSYAACLALLHLDGTCAVTAGTCQSVCLSLYMLL